MRTIPPLSPSEAEYQKAVTELLDRYGWMWVHFKPSMTSTGHWATHASGRAKGWPDLFCVRGHRMLALEVKSERGRVSEAQLDWLDHLGRCGVEAHVVRPSQWDWLIGIVK